jgi:hypothetical protein
MKKKFILISAAMYLCTITACSKSSDTPISPKKTSTPQLLINGGQWVTTSAVLYYPSGDSVVIPPNSSYLGVGGAFLLSDVIFKNDTLASESDFGNLLWSLSGSDPTYLNANFSGQLLTAKILSLSAHTLVLYINNGNESIPYETSANQSFDFTIFKQTLTN